VNLLSGFVWLTLVVDIFLGRTGRALVRGEGTTGHVPERKRWWDALVLMTFSLGASMEIPAVARVFMSPFGGLQHQQIGQKSTVIRWRKNIPEARLGVPEFRVVSGPVFTPDSAGSRTGPAHMSMPLGLFFFFFFGCEPIERLRNIESFKTISDLESVRPGFSGTRHLP